MRHAGVKYLIVRDVNFLNHRGENDWISRIEKGTFAACVYARLQFPNFRPRGSFLVPRVAPYDVSRFQLCGFYAKHVAWYPRLFPFLV